MFFECSIIQFSLLSCSMSVHIPLIDVRSPGEFKQGHIPNAINLPLFTDAERAVIGTLYKQNGHDAAVLEGLRIVGPKMAPLVEEATRIAPDKKLRVHCWRGGMRSNSVAWLFRQAGFKVEVLAGGYKNYRQQVLSSLAKPLPLVVLSGSTGSGKTYILHELKILGEQVIDLEGLAHHKGSAFGALGQGQQPSIEQFENNLCVEIGQFDLNKPIWIEDEARKIGSVFIQDHLWNQMKQAPLFNLDIPISERLDFLVKEYGHFEKEALGASILKIQKRLGGQHVKACFEALELGNLHFVAEVTLRYYDQTYAFGQSKRDPQKSIHFPCEKLDIIEIARSLKNYLQTHTLPIYHD